MLDEAKECADPEVTLSEPEFVLAVLKARSLIDAETLDAIRMQYAKIVGSHPGATIDSRLVFYHLVQQGRLGARDGLDLFAPDMGYSEWYERSWRRVVLEEERMEVPAGAPASAEAGGSLAGDQAGAPPSPLDMPPQPSESRQRLMAAVAPPALVPAAAPRDSCRLPTPQALPRPATWAHSTSSATGYARLEEEADLQQALQA